MGVRVIRRNREQACPAGDFVRVSTCSDPNDDTVTLATIQRVVEKIDAIEPAEAAPRRFVKTLIHGRPMTPDAAVGFATRYAERKKIPVVWTELA
jgi:hypothetical protein